MNLNEAQNPNIPIVQPGALEAISRAEIDMAIATARRYPQHQPGQLSTVKQAMMTFATLDEETAAGCFYTLPRGDKSIQGPSVRLAEIALSCYGNTRAASRIIATDTTGDNPHVIVQSVVMDLEKNIAVSIEKRRRIVGKKKKGGVIDEDDINLATNACSAIAFRDAVFKVVPLALIKPVFEAARKVAIGDSKTLATRRANCIEAFGKMGVTKERILAKLEVKAVSDITLENLETLIGMFNAIREGELIDDVFATEAQDKKADLSDLGPQQPQQQPQQPPPPTLAEHAEKKKEAAAKETAAQSEPTCKYCGEAMTPDHACEGLKAAIQKQPANTENKDKGKKEQQPAAAPDDAKEALKSVLLLLGQAEITPEQCMLWAHSTKLAKPDQKKLADLSMQKLISIANLLETPAALQEIKTAK